MLDRVNRTGTTVVMVTHDSTIEVSIFLRADVTDGQRAGLEAALQRNPLVKDIKYEDKQQAFDRFKGTAWITLRFYIRV